MRLEEKYLTEESESTNQFDKAIASKFSDFSKVYGPEKAKTMAITYAQNRAKKVVQELLRKALKEK